MENEEREDFQESFAQTIQAGLKCVYVVHLNISIRYLKEKLFVEQPSSFEMPN